VQTLLMEMLVPRAMRDRVKQAQRAAGLAGSPGYGVGGASSLLQGASTPFTPVRAVATNSTTIGSASPLHPRKQGLSKRLSARFF
jgi:hypothetical protein